MNKFKSLVKASFTGELNFFNVKATNGEKNSVLKSGILFFFLFAMLLFVAFQYGFMIAKPLHEVGLTYVMLTLFGLISVVLVFMEGIYKSQGILFEAKDNDLLFAMPIPRKTILGTRFLKLIYFEYVFNFIIMIPAFAVYAILETPSISFYLISLVMFVLLPIIPTILASIIGCGIKTISAFSKNKAKIQTFLGLLFTAALLIYSFRLNDLINNIVSVATSINDVISKLYLPIGLYIDNILSFDIIKFVGFILINIVPLIIFVYLFSIVYFNIISKSSETATGKKYKLTKDNFKANSKLKALFKKELKRYLSSPIYIFNTFFGVILIIIMAVALSINSAGTLEFFANTGQGIDSQILLGFIPKIFMGVLLFSLCMATITASSISLEGKSFEFTKSLPVDVKEIFKSKILLNHFVTIPLVLLSSILIIIRMNFSIWDTIGVLAICLIVPNIIAIYGLITNLRHPMLNATNDTVVVKQSMSTLIATFSGIGFAIFMGLIYGILLVKVGIELATIILIGVSLVVVGILWKVLNTYGVKLYNSLNN